MGQLLLFDSDYMDKTSRETLARLFTFEQPHQLSYHYRTKQGKASHKRDWPILREMIADKEVELLEKNSKEIIYRYLGNSKKDG